MPVSKKCYCNKSIKKNAAPVKCESIEQVLCFIKKLSEENLQPNVASIEKICAGFGITLSQFFQEDDSVYLTKEQKEPS